MVDIAHQDTVSMVVNIATRGSGVNKEVVEHVLNMRRLRNIKTASDLPQTKLSYDKWHSGLRKTGLERIRRYYQTHDLSSPRSSKTQVGVGIVALVINMYINTKIGTADATNSTVSRLLHPPLFKSTLIKLRLTNFAGERKNRWTELSSKPQTDITGADYINVVNIIRDNVSDDQLPWAIKYYI